MTSDLFALRLPDSSSQYIEVTCPKGGGPHLQNFNPSNSLRGYIIEKSIEATLAHLVDKLLLILVYTMMPCLAEK